MRERILVLAVDIDNDLFRKAKIAGPVLGKEENLKAAAALALIDPEDTDVNAMFEAVRKYDELKRMGYTVRIATLTGAEKEGYVADAALARQIDIVLDRFKIDACVLVTDGASDNRVLPLLKNRVKVNSVDIVRMKQAEQFENAYFAVLEKLKEPHYARIVFGVPALIMLLFAVSYYLNYGWQPPVALIGIYLIIKGLGLEDRVTNSFRGLGFSIERLSFVFYIGTMLFFAIALVVSYGSYMYAVQAGLDALSIVSYAIEGFILILPISLALYVAGRIIDLENRKLKYKAIKEGSYIGYGMMGVVLLYLTAAWFIGQIYFWELLVYSFVTILAGYGIARLSTYLRKISVRNAKMRGKQVVSDIGAYIGKVMKVQPNRGMITIKTNYGTLINYDIDRITNISDRITVK
jgi:putative membrane protein